MSCYKYKYVGSRWHPTSYVIYFDTIYTILIDAELLHFSARAFLLYCACYLFSHYIINSFQDYDKKEKNTMGNLSSK